MPNELSIRGLGCPVVLAAVLLSGASCSVDPASGDPASGDPAPGDPAGDPAPGDATSSISAEAQAGAITVSPRVSAASEAGDRAFFRVSLAAAPRSRVTVVAATSAPFEARVTPAVITFTPSNWSTPQILEVVSVDDDRFDGDRSVRVVFAPALSFDPAFAGFRLPSLDVLSVDDDYVVTAYRARPLVGSAAIESRAVAINQRGQVVGDELSFDGVAHPFLWDRGQRTDLGSLGGGRNQSHALDINDAGVVLGWSDTLAGVTRFLHDGQLTATQGETWAINDRGHTVGDALYADGQRFELPDLGDTPSTGLALNDSDHVTGFAPTPPFFQHAFYFADGAFTDLGTFGGPIGAGLAINEHDQVVGRMFNAERVFRPFLYDGEQVIDLGTATDAPGGIASGINNRGDIAGTDVDQGRMPMMAWVGRPGELRAIDTLLVDSPCFLTLEAVAINDSGFIAANGLECNVGVFHAFVLEPVKAARPRP
jgi:probable HAF family extracellular repeat protein